MEQIPGSEKGKSYDFEADVPADDADAAVAGKKVVYHIDVKEVKEEKIPEPTDEFAREVGEGFDTFAALRERVESDVRKRVEDTANREYEQKVLDSLIEQANLEYPPVLIEREIDHIISEQTGGGSRANLDAALRGAGRTEQEFRDELRAPAKLRVERSLVLTELATDEGLAVEPQDVEAELDRLAGGNTPQNARMREMFDTPTGREFIERTLLTRKVYDRLRDIAEGKELPPQAVVPRQAAADAPVDSGEAVTPATDASDPNEHGKTAEHDETAIESPDIGGGNDDKLAGVETAGTVPQEG